MKNINQNEISVVIPVLDFPKTLPEILWAIDNQTHRPKEIIIVCSGNHQGLKEFLNKNVLNVPINVQYLSKAYPGKARNIGGKLVKSYWIAFLDSKTLPNHDWLETYLNFSVTHKSDVVMGLARFIAKNKYQKLYNHCSYGETFYETVPGSIIKTKVFKNDFQFSPHYKVGEDRLWKETINKSALKLFIPNEHTIDYIDLPSNFLDTVKKYYFSSLNTYYKKGIKLEIFLSTFLIFYMAVLPKWNYLVDGWTNDYLFIPHISKLVTSSIFLLYLLHISITKFLNIGQNSIFSFVLNCITIISGFFVALNWNDIFANWDENHTMFFPHITKLYLISLFNFSIIIRGLIIPIKKKVKLEKLLPFRWVLIGLIGISLEFVKLFGIFIRVILKLRYLASYKRDLNKSS